MLNIGIFRRFALVEKCIVSFLLILAVVVASFVAIIRFGLYEFLNKLDLALIPSTVLGLLTCIFIWLNRSYWISVESKATFMHFLGWLTLIVAFLSMPNDTLRLIIYFIFPIVPISWIGLVKECPVGTPATRLMLGIHGGLGAYCLVQLVSHLLNLVGIPLPTIPACFLGTLVPYHIIATVVGAYIAPIVVVLACFIEETMFRLSLLIFKRFGMYPVAFLISFFFIYLHAVTRLYLDPATLVQALSCIACANAVFTAVFTRTLCIWTSVISHIIYNMLVILEVPWYISFPLLFIFSALTIEAYRKK